MKEEENKTKTAVMEEKKYNKRDIYFERMRRCENKSKGKKQRKICNENKG